MRKVFLSLILFLLFTLPSFAAINAEVEVNEGQVTINGTSDYKNMNVSVKVFNQNRSYYINQGKTDENGNFQFIFNLDENKEYSGKININGEIKELNISTSGSVPVVPVIETVFISVKGYDNETILSQREVEIEEGDTVLDVLVNTLNEEAIDYQISGGYVKGIDGLREFDHGPYSGWMFKVNGEFPDISADSVEVSNGDVIKWVYTVDLGQDVGNVYSEEIDLDTAVESAEEILDSEGASEEDIVEALDNILSALDAEDRVSDREQIDAVIIKLAEKAVKMTGSERIRSGEIEVNGDIATVSIDGEKLIDITDKVLDKINELEEKLEERDVETLKALEKKTVIELPHTGKKEIEAGLPARVLTDAFERGLEKIEINTEAAVFGITKGALDNNDDIEEIKLSVRKMDVSEIPENIRQEINEESVVVDLNFKVDNKIVNKFNKPVEISIKYDGEVKNEDEITVFLLNEKGLAEPMGGLYDSETKTVRFFTNHFSKYFVKPAVKDFSDLERFPWAERNIEIMAGKGFIKGRGENTFDPGASITRAEFAAIVVRMLKLDSSGDTSLNFQDVDRDRWYYEPVKAAYENGLINGRSDSIFDPEGKITRQEIAKIIDNVLRNRLYKPGKTRDLNGFEDREEIADWAKDAVALLVKLGIVEGRNNGCFDPKANANRGEAAVMLYRLFKKL